MQRILLVMEITYALGRMFIDVWQEIQKERKEAK